MDIVLSDEGECNDEANNICPPNHEGETYI
jgi:hypothetical protein